MKNICVEILVPVTLSFIVENSFDITNEVAVLREAKSFAQSAADDGELDICYDDDENGITLKSVEDMGTEEEEDDDEDEEEEEG